MKLAISNIAWSPAESAKAYDLLCAYGADGLEIAPGLAFPDEPEPTRPSDTTLRAFQADLDRRRLRLVSMQSLLFGIDDAFLFGSTPQCERFTNGIRRAIDLAGRLGIPNLVLGSPKNRAIPDCIPRDEAMAHAHGIFRALGDDCAKAGCVIAMEPNPAAYGTNFLNTIGETIAFVEQLNHPHVTVNFDLGAMHMTGEITEACALYKKARPRVSHIHISEPHLAAAPANIDMFTETASGILSQGYDNWFSIEMRAEGSDNIGRVETALQRAVLGLERAAQGNAT